MEIQFNKIDGLWVAEFEVTTDFNLHIERDTEGRLDIYQRTAGGEFEYIYDTGYLNRRLVFDNDFSALVYPKWIKIKSAVKPLVATITTDGEVNEVVYQAKDIEITSNGTTKVTADTGYTALGSVNVKVNVPTEGGGESGDTMEYFLAREIAEVGGFASLLKIFYGSDGTLAIYPTSMFAVDETNENSVIAVGLDFQSEYIGKEPFNGKLIDIIIKMGLTKEQLDAIPRITKEEFYNLSNIIKFSINSESFFAEKGMTWQQFAMSNYNNNQRVRYEESYQAISYNGNPIIGNDGMGVKPYTEIISGANYTSEEVG